MAGCGMKSDYVSHIALFRYHAILPCNSGRRSCTQFVHVRLAWMTDVDYMYGFTYADELNYLLTY